MVNVILSEQDLGDFLDGNQEYMEAYRAELERRLADRYGEASVGVDANTLVDKFELSDDVDRAAVDYVMNQVANDWSWLPE